MVEQPAHRDMLFSMLSPKGCDRYEQRNLQERSHVSRTIFVLGTLDPLGLFFFGRIQLEAFCLGLPRDSHFNAVLVYGLRVTGEQCHRRTVTYSQLHQTLTSL